MAMHIKTNLKKHRFSPFLSWAWLLAGLAVLVGIHHAYFVPIFTEQFQTSLAPIKPLYWGSMVCYLAVGWSMFSGRKLPYSNNVEVLFLMALFSVCTLLLLLAASREYYSGVYLLVLFCFQLVWLGIEVYVRNHFVTYRFAVFPSSLPFAAGDFLEHDVVFLNEGDAAARMDGVDAVVVDFTAGLEPPFRELLSQCQQSGIPIIPLNLFLENVWGRIHIELFNDMMVSGTFSLRPYLLLKPVLERGMSLIGLLVTAPVIAVAAVAVKTTSPGPVFFVRNGSD